MAFTGCTDLHFTRSRVYICKMIAVNSLCCSSYGAYKYSSCKRNLFSLASPIAFNQTYLSFILSDASSWCDHLTEEHDCTDLRISFVHTPSYIGYTAFFLVPHTSVFHNHLVSSFPTWGGEKIYVHGRACGMGGIQK